MMQKKKKKHSKSRHCINANSSPLSYFLCISHSLLVFSKFIASCLCSSTERNMSFSFNSFKQCVSPFLSSILLPLLSLSPSSIFVMFFSLIKREHLEEEFNLKYLIEYDFLSLEPLFWPLFSFFYSTKTEHHPRGEPENTGIGEKMLS